MHLSKEHIDYITRDLHDRGVIAEGIEDELIDHICSSVEAKMNDGWNFIEAYQNVIQSFGRTTGLRETQKETIQQQNSITNIMFRNYIKIGLRSLRKQGFYSVINITGFAVGIAACLLIFLYIQDELSYDSYNDKADRIYRVNNEVQFGGNHIFLATSTAPFAHALQEEYPEVEATVRLRTLGTYLVKTTDDAENTKELYLAWADSTFFKVFSVPVLEGNPSTALKEAGGVAISKRIAEKYFPGVSALGKPLILDNVRYAHVTAVYENIPAASHFHFDILISMIGDWPIARQSRSTVFINENFNTYVLLREGASAKDLESKIPAFHEKYMGPSIAQVMGPDFTMKKFWASGNKYQTTLMPIRDIHLHSDATGEFEPNGNITYVYLFGIIALFILAIACVNFMNLSTARSSNRAKEVGVRKVMGSLRTHLIRQFLTESILITFFSFVVAVALAYLILPLFNDLAQKNLSIPFSNSAAYVVVLGAAIIIGSLAGLYPSFFLSAFKPVNVLKGRLTLDLKSGAIRSGLVVFQFMVTIFLIVGAITVQRQLAYIQSKKLGFNKDQVIIVKDGYALRPNVQAFKNEVMKIPAIETGTISGYLPVLNVDARRSQEAYWKEGQQPTQENLLSLQEWNGDFDYLKTFGMQVKEGRGFSPEFPSDSSAILLNEAAVKQFDLGPDPIGKKVVRFDPRGISGGVPDQNKVLTFTVIGILENFHFSSLKDNISPLVLVLGESDGNVSFRFKADQASATIKNIEAVWRKIAPGQPFQYSFLDDDFEKMYTTEQRLGNIFSVFATLAILIACMGLFALTAFTAEQRTKEIGIRKVLGASIGSIVMLLSREFGKLIFIAFVLAVPLAWYAVSWWLKGYTFKVDIGAGVYAAAGVLALIIAGFTISYQSLKAATADPVKSLKSE